MQSTTQYDERFFAYTQRRSTYAAERIVALVHDLVAPRSVCDVGCGLGVWLAQHRARGAAKILGIDDEVGSLEPGKRADMVVLDDDPFAIAAADLDRTRVVATWLDGVVGDDSLCSRINSAGVSASNGVFPVNSSWLGSRRGARARRSAREWYSR